ncbi:MAG TPA: hypothetical protein VEJ67_05010 [Candidatus Cybelea sp.]|nr:hypothetical protein [Candidatus Cybelea sp.]
MDPHESSIQRRRSERVAQSLPVLIRGVDLLGQPFEERTATLSFNLHGCRYASRYHLPKNSWVTLETVRGSELRNARARVAWIQRPHSVREFFQVSVELEKPINLWSYEPTPSDWDLSTEVLRSSTAEADPGLYGRDQTDNPQNLPTAEDLSMSHLSSAASQSAASEAEVRVPLSVESPQFRELRVQLEGAVKQSVDEAAAHAAEQIRKVAEEKQAWISEEAYREWKQEFESAQNAAREQMAKQQAELVGQLQAEFEEGLRHAKQLIAEVERSSDALRAETGAASEAVSRLASARLELEAVQATRNSYAVGETPNGDASEPSMAAWRERLHSEMAAAQAQWNELLESSLDGGVARIAQQLSGEAKEIASEVERKLSERIRELRQPLLETLEAAQQSLGGIKGAVDEELGRAKTSLAEIEDSAAHMNDVSAQLEASRRVSLDELSRRFQGILDAQTQEMGERAEATTAAALERARLALEDWKQKTVESASSEVEGRLAAQVDRASQAAREMSAREVQVEETLRLHRERLRQMAETTRREFASGLDGTVAEARSEFETARQEALGKWNEDLSASGVRASQAAAEAIEKACEGFERDARARLQTVVEQTVAAAGTGLEEKTSEAKQKFASDLGAESSAQLARIQGQLDGAAAEAAGRARSEIEQAAELTAAAFGQVLRGISDQETEHFTARSQEAVEGQTQELENRAAQLLRNFETSAESSLARLHTQMAAQAESSIADGRSALASEFNALLVEYRSEQDAHQKDWYKNLERMSGEAAERFQERLGTSADSWIVSAVRRLNEHGQTAIESLMRSANQALRDSCARIFEGIAEALRQALPDADNYSPAPSQEAAEAAATPPLTPSDSPLDAVKG